jgi:uncharacterized membrane protein YdjX (TVP38/TMEM64 family)
MKQFRLTNDKRARLYRLLVWLSHHARQNSLLIMMVSLWLIVVFALYGYLAGLAMTPQSIAILILTFVSSSMWGPILFVAAYAVRPLLFFPATVLTVGAGIVFGFWLGLLYTLIGATLSAMVAYVVGRYLSFVPKVEDPSSLQSWRRLLEDRPFEATLFLHLTFFPFDVVNYFSGILRISFISFVLGVFLGIIPAVLSVVSFGASIDIELFLKEGFSMQMFDARYLGLAVAIFIASLIIASAARSYRDKRLR